MSASLATRRVVSAFLAAGALVGAAALPAAADGHQRDHRAPQSSIVIGEVQYESPGRNDRSARALNGEWVELKNTGRHSVNLRGYTLTDRQGNRYRFNDFRLEGRSSVKVHTGKGRDTRHDVYQDRRDQVWDERDSATLRDNRGNVVDSDSWDGRRHHRHH
ncbi:lamin tail domain-containing protein [Streptomyces sp. NPDC059456]|uniref:lamin tail domain-containing protein n=1 Tax=Streptomyces sp. NPDC059456 TaxID=3346838 RepID=UPI0036CD5B11